MNLADVLSPPDQTPAYKPFWMSKTLWTAAIMALVPLYPPVGAWVAANPILASAAISALFAGIRIVSHGKLTIN